MAGSQDIVNAYQGILFRSPLPGDFTYYAPWPVTAMIDDLIMSSESRNTAHRIIGLYDVALGRRPDKYGAIYWADFAKTNGITTALVSMASGFLGSVEGQLRYPPADSHLQFISKIYSNGLRRSVTPAEATYWDGVLTAGTFTRAQLLAHIVTEAEYITLSRSYMESFQQQAGLDAPGAWTGILF